MTDRKMQGEGNYEAAREYDRETTAHAQDHDKVKAAARKARAALDSPEAADLKAAEAEGKAKARE